MCDGCRDCPDVDYISEDSEDTYFLHPPREMSDPVEDAASGISIDEIILDEFDGGRSEILDDDW